MDNYDDFLNGINSQDREEKNTKIINEFKAFLKLNNSVYNTFSGVKAEIDNILNNPISVDEAEYYQKLFPSFFEHLKNIKTDLSFFPEYTFVPEYQKLIDKHYTFIMRDMTLAEAETTRQRMLQLLEENRNLIIKPKNKDVIKIHHNPNEVIEQIVNIIIGEDNSIEVKKIEHYIVSFEINSANNAIDNFYKDEYNSYTNTHQTNFTGLKIHNFNDVKINVKFIIDFQQVTGYEKFENSFSILGSNSLIKEKSGFSKELDYDYDHKFIYPNVRKHPLPIKTKMIPDDYSWFNWQYNVFPFTCSFEAQERISNGIDLLIEILEQKKLF